MNPLVLLATLASAGGVFTALPEAPRGGLLFGTLLPMTTVVAFAILVSGRPNAVAIMSGAVAAFLGALAWPVAGSLAGAMVVGLAYAERTLRVRPFLARVAHVALSVVAGASAGGLVASYVASPWLYRGVATGMACVLASLPLLLPAESPRVVALEAAARRLGPPIAAALLDGADLLKLDVSLLDEETARNVAKSWRSLDKLVDARLALVSAARPGETAAMVTAMVDKQIRDHVASLTRAYTAARTVGAAEVGIDDQALRDVHARGEALEEQSRAIVEVGARR